MQEKKQVKKGKLVLTNTDKLYWPTEKITKGELIAYYETMAPFILPYLKNRPLSLKRNPNGIKDDGFYHKDAGDIAPEWMKTFNVTAASTGKAVHYLVCNTKDSLLFIANLGCIEMNPWNSVIAKPDFPDYLVMDIDPSAKNNFSQVVDVALVIKEILDEAGIEGFCKTSGATGMHIYLPCKRKYEYEQVRSFAKIIATKVVERLPKTTTIERSLAKRSKSQVYIDYLQNSKGQTLASAFSVRPRPGATVSMPLMWKEVKSGLDPMEFTMKTMPARMKKRKDSFLSVLGAGIDITKALKRLGV